MHVTTPDSTRIAVSDWGTGRPVVLVHAWGLNSHMWNAQLPALLAAGLRVVTIDLRGHGSSDRPSSGYDIETMAGDVAAVLDELDVDDAVLVGHSMGGAICARLAGGLGTRRVGALVLSAATTPCLTLGPDNDLGLPAEAFVQNRAALAADVAGWIVANTAGYWGADENPRPLETNWTQRTLYETPLPILLATNEAITTADLREDVAQISCPVLVVHGDADQSAPLEITGRPTAALAPQAALHVIPGAGHGLYTSFAESYNAELIRFAGAA